MMKDENSEYIILDSSALIAIFNNEKGHEILIPLLPKAIMSSVNMAEVAKFLIHSRNYSKQEAFDTMSSMLHKIIPFDAELALISAEIIHQTKPLGLSLGARACIALGLHTVCPIYTADKIWAKLKLDCKIVLIR